MKILSFFSFTIICLCSCYIARPRYTPPTDLETNNLKGRVSVVRSLYLSLDGSDENDPDRTAEFDMLIVSYYNPQGNITLEETYSGGGERLSKRDEYMFDESGKKLISSEYHNVLNNGFTWTYYNYDKKGRLQNYYADESDWQSNLEYGKRNYPAKLVTMVADTVNSVIVYEYDRKGRLVKKGNTIYKYDKDKLKETAAEFYREYYDENGDIVRTVNVITDLTAGEVKTWDGIVEARYEYDSHGNWIRRELYLDGNMFGVWLREIEYFDS